MWYRFGVRVSRFCSDWRNYCGISRPVFGRGTLISMRQRCRRWSWPWRRRFATVITASFSSYVSSTIISVDRGMSGQKNPHTVTPPFPAQKTPGLRLGLGLQLASDGSCGVSKCRTFLPQTYSPGPFPLPDNFPPRGHYRDIIMTNELCYLPGC